MEQPGEKVILAVAPSPSIDRAIVIPGYRLGEIHRPQQVLALAGGKGLNVARAVQRLGGAVQVCTLLAGHNGRWIADQLAQEGIPFRAAWYPGETRLSTSIIDPKQPGELTEIYEYGDPVTPQAWLEFENLLADSLEGVSWAAISGSLPLNAPGEGMQRMLDILAEKGTLCAVDGRGTYLRAALEGQPALIKVNAVEAGEVFGRQVKEPYPAVALARDLLRSKQCRVVITLGAAGAVAVDRTGAWIGRLPPLSALAPVGSGDAFLGAFLLALTQGAELDQALRWGVAAGAANSMSVGVAMIERLQVEQLTEQVILERA